MVPPAPRECSSSQRLHRANATSSPRLYLRMQLQPARCACICACNCNQLAAPNQPARIARRARRASPSHTSHLQLCTRFAVLCPEKYHKFLVKCKEPNRKYYHSKTNPVIINEPYIKSACDLFTDSIHSP
jgi:hypothetical protein